MPRPGKRKYHMAKIVNARGLSCPEPVIRTKNAISEEEFPFQVEVDTLTSVQNISRLLKKTSLAFSVEEKEDGYTIVVHSEERIGH